jgi:hypothetical protein
MGTREVETGNLDEPQSDAWADWLLHQRHGDDPEFGRVVSSFVTQYADRVLDKAGLHRWKAAQFPDTAEKCAASAIANFSERDLLNFAGNAGFVQIHLQLHIDVMPSLSSSWDVFLDTSPHPLAPSLRRIMADQFSPEECSVFEQAYRPTVESGKTISIDRVAYLQATKV